MDIHGTVFTLLIFLFLTCKCKSENKPVVTLPFGKIFGILANGYYDFHNIPFAVPPIGKHRFEPPIPYTQSWDEELDGTQPMVKCISFDQFAEPAGSEDCLYLHVITPDINCDKMYPVRIHIHSGAYNGGSPDTVDTSILGKRGKVIVTMGYRLGPLGFLSTGDKVISGNNGLKDQRLAIKWVKANIKNFCGDENNILLAGASAGGAAAHMHLLHKPTENYVNAVASHNGVASCPWALEPDPKYLSKTFADLLQCQSDSSESIKACLQGKSIDELRKSAFALQYYKNNPFTIFAPVVESPDSEDPLITQHPEEIMRNGQVANVTLLMGYTEREGSYNSAALLALNEHGVADIEILNERWEELAPIMMFFNRSRSEDERRQYSNSLRDTYLGKNKFSEENYRLVENMYTDVLFLDEIKKSLFLHRKYCPGKVYAYYYKYPHEFTIGNVLARRNDINFGADHAADTIFIMPRTALKQTVYSDRDIRFSEKLIDMYLNWANKGNSTQQSAKQEKLQRCGSVPNLSGNIANQTNPTSLAHLLSPNRKQMYIIQNSHRRHRHHHHQLNGRHSRTRSPRLSGSLVQRTTRESACSLLQPMPYQKPYWNALSVDETGMSDSQSSRIIDRTKRSDTAKRHLLLRQKPIENEDLQNDGSAPRRRSSTLSDLSYGARWTNKCPSMTSRTPSVDSKKVQVDLHSPQSQRSCSKLTKRVNSGPSSTPSVEREFRSQLSICSEPITARQLSGQSSIEPCVLEESPESDEKPPIDKPITKPGILKKSRPETLPINNNDLVKNLLKEKTCQSSKILYRSNSSNTFYRPKPRISNEYDTMFLKNLNGKNSNDAYDSLQVINERRKKILKAESDTTLLEKQIEQDYPLPKPFEVVTQELGVEVVGAVSCSLPSGGEKVLNSETNSISPPKSDDVPC